MEAAYKGIAKRLNLPGQDGSRTDVLELVIDWLADEGNERWLSVVNNAVNALAFSVRAQGHYQPYCQPYRCSRVYRQEAKGVSRQ